jgi:hypothetical protein
MNELYELKAALVAALDNFLGALLSFVAAGVPLPPQDPIPAPVPPVSPAPAPTYKVRVKNDQKVLLNVFTNRDKEGKPIMFIWHDEDGQPARFDEGTIFTVLTTAIIATGGSKWWELSARPGMFIEAVKCIKIG